MASLFSSGQAHLVAIHCCCKPVLLLEVPGLRVQRAALRAFDALHPLPDRSFFHRRRNERLSR